MESKTCQQCGESIKPIARKCPYCQSWQKGFNAFMSNSNYAGLLPLLVIIPLFFVYYTIRSTVLKEAREFDQYRNSVSVKESKIYYSAGEQSPTISLLGKIQNDSDIKWTRIHIEVQYFNSVGVLIDTQTASEYDSVLPPHGEYSFRLRQTADKPQSEYASHKVRILDANDGEGWP